MFVTLDALKRDNRFRRGRFRATSLEISRSRRARRVIDGEAGMSSLDRRRFLQASAAVGSSLLATGIGRPAAAAARIEVPAVDRIVVQEVTDGAHDVFLRDSEQPGLAVQRTGSNAAKGK